MNALQEKSCAKVVVKQNGTALQYFSREIRRNRDVVLAAAIGTCGRERRPREVGIRPSVAGDGHNVNMGFTTDRETCSSRKHFETGRRKSAPLVNSALD